MPLSAPADGGPAAEPAAKEPAPEPETNAPKAGRIKHVFVIALTSPGYEQAFGAQTQMPYLSATLRPQGELLSGYTLIGESGLANHLATISGQPPNPATSAGCPSYEEFAATAKADRRGIVAGSGCAYSVETLTIADQLTSGRFAWHAYVEGMVDETGNPHGEDAQLLLHRTDAVQLRSGGEVPPLAPPRAPRTQMPFSRSGCRRSSPHRPTRKTGC